MSAIAMTLTGEMSMDMLVSLSLFEAPHGNGYHEMSLDILLEGAIPTPVHMTDSITSAAQQVFTVPELLELILFSLPVHDLSLCQRTCRSFHRTIRGSCDLKQRLFLEPVTLNNNVLRLSPLLLRLGESTGPISHIYIFVMPEDLERPHSDKAQHLTCPRPRKCFTPFVRAARQADPKPLRTRDTGVRYMIWDIQELRVTHDPAASFGELPKFQPWQHQRLQPISSAWDMLLYHGKIDVQLKIWRYDQPHPGSDEHSYPREQYGLEVKN